MNGLKEFLELLTKDEALQEQIKKVKDDTSKIVEIAKNNGYTFTEQEYDYFKMEAVSGGINLDAIAGKTIEIALKDGKVDEAIRLVSGLKKAGVF